MVKFGSLTISTFRRYAAAALTAGAMLAFAGHANMAAAQGPVQIYNGPAPDVFSAGSVNSSPGGQILVNDQGQVVIRDQASIVVEGGGSLEVSDTASVTVEDGGSLVVETNGTVEVTDSARISFDDSFSSVSGTFSMQSDNRVEFSNNSFMSLGGDFIQSNGTVEVQAGSIIAGDGSFALNGGTTVLNGQLILQPQTIFDPPTSVSVTGGTLLGAGTVLAGAVTNSGGTVGPGDGTGTMNVIGDYTQGPGGTLAIDIDSLLAFDLLSVIGDVTLDGLLDLQVDPGYAAAAQVGDSFTIMEWSSFSGAFDTVTGGDLGGGKFFTLDYENSGLTLTVNAQTVVGVPEPGMIALFGLGLAGIGFARRHRARI